MSSSRFAHFNTINGDFNADDESMDTQDGNNTSSNNTMTVTAGVRLQNPPNTGSFVTALINGGDKPDFDKATVIKPTSNSQNGQGEVITYNDLDQGIRENGQIGHVSFSNGGTRVKSGLFKAKPGNNNLSKTVTFPILNPVKITVRNLENHGKCDLQMSSTDTVEQLKNRIYEEKGWTTQGRHLINCGKNMECNKTLQDYEFIEKSEILLSCRNRGG